jgi:hypothetical protein
VGKLPPAKSGVTRPRVPRRVEYGHTGANSFLFFLTVTGPRVVDLYFACAGSGEALNVSQLLEETSPYLWASTNRIQRLRGRMVRAPLHHTQPPAAVHGVVLVCSFISSPVSSKGHLRHWLIHPRRWCQGPPHTDQESHQVCIPLPRNTIG